MWAGDVDRLHELAPCRCCCHEHTADHCPARAWFGCKGEGYRKNCTSSRCDTYSLDVAVALYPHKGELYLRAFCERVSILRGVLDFVREMPGLEDFHYQNSTDKPDDVSEDDWARRDETWHEIAKYEGVGRHVALDIVCWDAFYRIDPSFDLQAEWHKSPPELPIREEVWARKLRRLRPEALVIAEPGRIAMDSEFVVSQAASLWVTTLDGVVREHETLNQAAEHVWFELLPEQQKDLVRRLVGREYPSL